MNLHLSLQHAWHRLTRPSPQLAPDEQNRARILASFLLISVGGGLLVHLIIITMLPPESLQFHTPQVAGFAATMILPYGFSRSRYYFVGSLLTVILLIIFVFVLSTLGDVYFLYYLLVPVFASSFLLSLPATGLVIALCLVFLWVFARSSDHILESDMLQISVYILFISSFMMLAAYYRRQIEDRNHAEMEERVRVRTVELLAANRSLKQEVAERKQAEAALQASENRLRQLTEMTSASIFIFREEEMRYVNPAAAALTGYTEPELQRMKFIQLIHPDYQADVQRWVEESQLRGARPSHLEVRLQQKKGQTCWVEMTLGAVVFADIPAMMCTIFDITARKEAENERQQQAQELETLNRINTAVSQALDLTELFQILEEIMVDTLGVPGGGIISYHAAEERLELKMDWGFPPGLLNAVQKFALNSDLILRTLHEKRSMLVADFRDISFLNLIGLATRRETWQSFLTIPLIGKREIVGILFLFSRAPATFSGRQIGFFKSIGQQIGIAIQNTRLFAAEQQARQVSDLIKDANIALTRTLSLPVVLETLLDFLQQLINYDSGNVMLRHGPNQVMIVAERGYERWHEDKFWYGMTFDLADYPNLNKICIQRKSVLIPDVDNAPIWTQGPNGKGIHIQSWVGVPLIAGGEVIGLYSLDKAEAGFFTETDLELAEALAAQAAVAVQNALLFAQVQEDQEELRRLAQQVVNAQEAERQRVSRELHDEAGQALTALKFSLAMILSKLPADTETEMPAELRQHVRSAVALCETTMDQVRRLAHDLRPAALDDLGLHPALEGYCLDFAAHTRLVIHYQGVEPPILPDAAKITLYRFLQEALTNVARHAQATAVQVKLGFDEGYVNLMVVDNGRGLWEQMSERENGRVEGMGLSGMMERLQLVGGHLQIQSQPEGGTQLTACVPW